MANEMTKAELQERIAELEQQLSLMQDLIESAPPPAPLEKIKYVQLMLSTDKKIPQGAPYIAQNGTIALGPQIDALVVEYPGESLHYTKECLRSLKFVLAAVCGAYELNPITQIVGELRGLMLPSLKQRVANMIAMANAQK